MAFNQNDRLITGLTFYPAQGIASPSTTKQNGAAVNMAKARKTTARVSVGTISSSETITASWEGSILGASTWVALTSSSQTILTAQGSNSAIVLETTAENLNAYNTANGTTFKFVRPTVTCAVGSPIVIDQIAAAGPEEPMSNLNPTTILGTFVF